MISYDISKTAERIKNLRKKAGYTQEQVADLLNVDRRTISNIEGGRKGCSVDMFLRFSELYGVTLDYIIMNISGVRGYKEDTSNTGHETRLGMIVAENEEASAWNPLCCQFKTPDGEDRFQPGDNAISMYFFCNRDSFKCQDTASALEAAVNERVYGQDSGMAIAFPPNITEKMAKDNMTPERVMDYIVKYARRPFNEFPRGMKGNNHEPKNTVLPFGGNYPVEKYISTDHFMVFTGGNMGTNMPKAVTWLTDGGHGTPSCAKIHLPKDWDKLVADYRASTEITPVKYY